MTVKKRAFKTKKSARAKGGTGAMGRKPKPKSKKKAVKKAAKKAVRKANPKPAAEPLVTTADAMPGGTPDPADRPADETELEAAGIPEDEAEAALDEEYGGDEDEGEDRENVY